MHRLLTFVAVTLLAVGIALAPVARDFLVAPATGPSRAFHWSLSSILQNAFNGFKETISGYIEKSNGSSKETNQAIYNMRAAREAQRIAQRAFETYTIPGAGACETSDNSRRSVQAKIPAELWAKAITAAKVQVTTQTENSSALAGARVAEARALYCSELAEKRGQCTRQPNTAMQDADVNVGTIMVSNAGETMSDDEYKASLKFIDNVTNVVPIESLPRAMEQTPQGQRFLLEQRRHAAALSGAQYSLARIVAARRIQN